MKLMRFLGRTICGRQSTVVQNVELGQRHFLGHGSQAQRHQKYASRQQRQQANRKGKSRFYVLITSSAEASNFGHKQKIEQMDFQLKQQGTSPERFQNRLLSESNGSGSYSIVEETRKSSIQNEHPHCFALTRGAAQHYFALLKTASPISVNRRVLSA
jgi:hypothetical protein